MQQFNNFKHTIGRIVGRKWTTLQSSIVKLVDNLNKRDKALKIAQTIRRSTIKNLFKFCIYTTFKKRHYGFSLSRSIVKFFLHQNQKQQHEL